MRAAGQNIPLQYVYLKVNPPNVTIKARLNTLNKYRHHQNPSPGYDLG